MDIRFHLLTGFATDVLPEFISKNKIGGVVTDFSPLRVPIGWVNDVVKKLPDDVPLCQVCIEMKQYGHQEQWQRI